MTKAERSKLRMRFARGMGAACLALLLVACQSTQEPPAEPAPAPAAPPPVGSSAALDSSVIITPPDAKVPKQYAAFSGIWAGTWDDMLDARLAVRTVAANGRVTVTYAWGQASGITPGIVDGQGKIGAAKMKLDRFASGVDTVFIMQGDGTLAGTYTVNGVSHQGVFRRQ